MRVLLCLAVLGLCSFVGLVIAAGFFLSNPRLGRIGPPPSGLAGAEAVAILTTEGVILHGWFLDGAPSAPAILLLHGLGGNRLQMVARAIVLHEAGYAVLLIDFRGHGESIAPRITFGQLEAHDAAASVAYLHARLPGVRVGAIGMSLGGAALVLGPTALDVDALVLESVYPDLDSALTNRFKVVLGPTLGAITAPVLKVAFTTLLPPILGIDPLALRPIDGIARVKAPVLVVAGTIDDRTPFPETQAIFDHAPAPKTLWAVEGAGHVDLENFARARYWDVILPFLDNTLR